MATDDPERLRDLADTLDDWNHPLGSADLCRRVADEIERVRTELAACMALIECELPLND